MADAPKDDENIDEAKLDRVLKKLLSTPPKPHSKKPERKPDAKPKPDRRPAPR
jgi:hypothetical protein